MSKLKSSISVFFGLAVLILSACQNEEDTFGESKTGFLISLQDDVTVNSRSIPSELESPVTSNFHLRIVRDATGNAIYDDNYTDGLIAAAEGSYTISATYGNNPEIALDDPYYAGETSATVTTGQTTSATVTCKVANALTSVVFQNQAAFDSELTDYAVKVAVGSQSVKLTTDGRSAYYRANSAPVYTFVGTLRDGSLVSIPLSDDKLQDEMSFAAAAHCKITLSLNMTAGLKVTINKVEVETVKINQTIPMKWLPTPKVQADGFDNNALTIVETETKSAALNLNIASALQEVKFKFHFEDSQYTALNAKEEYLLSDADDKALIEQTLGITLPSVGDTQGEISLSDLVNHLQTNAGTTTTNTIDMDVKANDRWSSENTTANTTYTMTCTKPEFSVSVDERNSWAREFTIDEIAVTSGDATKLKSNLTYQYYNGSEWVDCSTREAVKGRAQQFTAEAANISQKTYQVRALYRGAVPSTEATATLESPEQLDNSGMENWYTEKGGSFNLSESWTKKVTYYKFYPYASGSSDIWWATNNERSQDGNVVLGLGHPVCFAPCVSYSESEKHNGSRSALIYTSGHGGGYTSTGEIIYTDGSIAGNLFIGTYSWSGSKETTTTGHSFPSRPTSLSFWYKYIPKNSDEFKVYIEIRNGDEVVSSGTYIPSTISSETEWTQYTIPLSYGEPASKATSVYVQFLSTTKTSFSSSDFDKDKTFSFPNMSGWKVHMGSMLYIDDISLIYDK